MDRISAAVDRLIAFAEQNLELDARNACYARNTVLDIVGAETYTEQPDVVYGGESCAQLLSELTDACVAEGLISEEEKDRCEDEVAGALMLSPKEVEEEFSRRAAKSSKDATEWFYRYSVACDYVKKEKLDKNPRFTAKNGLIVTINKAKPEFRDPKKAASGNSTKGGYPKCTICRENEGYAGRQKRTLRTVGLRLGGQDWFWQYSPYGYFYQHGIAVNCKHTPMHVDSATFNRLMDFVDQFPHYFIGCNAALPLIGGSVLAHDHYQGGGETLPLQTAKIAIALKHEKYPDVEVGVCDWFGTAVRVTGKNRDSVAAVSEIIRKGWVEYGDRERGIIPYDENGIHSAISPTVVKAERGYEMTIILRNNITSEQYPDGVFHAHPEFHVIKKESIGLIEAQGLFILPGRLEKQLKEVEECLVNGCGLPKELSEFSMICEETRERCPEHPTAEQASEAMREELASVCERILQNTAVFKTHRETEEFMKGLGFENV